MQLSNYENIGLGITNYKCFGEEIVGFNSLKPMNIIVGRNNSGKSSLLELVEFFCELGNEQIKKAYGTPKNQHQPRAYLTTPITPSEIKKCYNNRELEELMDGELIRYRLLNNNKMEFDSFVKEPPGRINRIVPNKMALGTSLAQKFQNPFANLSVLRIHAERNIIPEQQTTSNSIKGNGEGCTDMIRMILNDVRYPRELVEEKLLAELNKIFFPDSIFLRILVEQSDNSHWEIFLEEEHKGRIKLSHCGNGLKTIILVLSFIHLQPEISNKKLSEYVFLFEELENNIHPALQRRLLRYLREISIENNCLFFLTTHSNIAIDVFSKDENAQVVHVQHDGASAKVTDVLGYKENKSVLSDLDVRASDLLQSNAVVWLEGPSDRLYFNRWIELFTGGKIQEGAHYQCVYYGGKLLSHIDAKAPSDEHEALINILNINQNAILLMDSDIKKNGKRINQTKQRVKRVVTDMDGYAWVTKGREIENYIPKSALKSLLGTIPKNDVPQYDNFFEFLEKQKATLGDYYQSKKIVLAEKIVDELTLADLQKTLDLEKHISGCVKKLQEWNRI